MIAPLPQSYKLIHTSNYRRVGDSNSQMLSVRLFAGLPHKDLANHANLSSLLPNSYFHEIILRTYLQSHRSQQRQEDLDLRTPLISVIHSLDQSSCGLNQRAGLPLFTLHLSPVRHRQVFHRSFNPPPRSRLRTHLKVPEHRFPLGKVFVSLTLILIPTLRRKHLCITRPHYPA